VRNSHSAIAAITVFLAASCAVAETVQVVISPSAGETEIDLGYNEFGVTAITYSVSGSGTFGQGACWELNDFAEPVQVGGYPITNRISVSVHCGSCSFYDWWWQSDPGDFELSNEAVPVFDGCSDRVEGTPCTVLFEWGPNPNAGIDECWNPTDFDAWHSTLIPAEMSLAGEIILEFDLSNPVSTGQPSWSSVKAMYR